MPGNPGGTSRELTVAQLAYERDYALPSALARLSELRGVLEEFERRGPEQLREANEELFYVENSYKVVAGRRLALVDPSFFASKVAAEKRLRAAVAARPALQAADGSAWTQLAALQTVRGTLAARQDAAAGVAARTARRCDHARARGGGTHEAQRRPASGVHRPSVTARRATGRGGSTRLSRISKR